MANIKQRKELDLQKWPYDMTQLVLNIEDKKMVASLKRVLATMNGVTIASSKSLSPYEKSKLKRGTAKSTPILL